MDGVFAINKPTGISSAQFVAKIQHIFTASKCFSKQIEVERQKLLHEGCSAGAKKKARNMKVKMGHGGTLDPLASGILIIGVNKGTKKLQDFLNGSVKTYETEALLGASTTTGDCEGEIVSFNATSHITKEQVLATREKFVGELTQTPPIFSALKMDGKPLYEYVREGKPLPRPIASRQVQIYDMQFFEDDMLTTDHSYELLKGTNDLAEKIRNNPTLEDDKLHFSAEYLAKAAAEGLPVEAEKQFPSEGKENEEGYKAPLIHFTAKVGSGTYIRSLISDVGKALQSSSYMVKLIRTEQADWKMNQNVLELEDLVDNDEVFWSRVVKRILDTEDASTIILKDIFDQVRVEVAALPEKEGPLELAPVVEAAPITVTSGQGIDRPIFEEKATEEHDSKRPKLE
ncbi:hypothetical protein BABINDRAFT_160773 [Babjeviella inositovora NRRL Y-12698]|uniref:tRNA pseudouridine(55) synthase n=1 Tax=Babjeviella inositovora NRRL Y-12698 TaxID=984486 RepID=A0A1E3QS84_9ASCO|nr:uncharacterized protein BABINDRAFT_160773 [Babjeviella inositovora NRRL Y-12698]ODQ80498.1 hypothetical protein BABINDRAFT_160773 [Babjeviella inositovora NRRL Y-12698]